MSKCAAIKANGERCRGVAIDSTGLCYSHHPDHADARARAARKGGRRGGRGRPLLEVHDVVDQLQVLADRVLAGDLDRSDASVCGQLLNYKLRGLESLRRWKETEELASEVEELRALVNVRKEGNRWAYGSS